MTQILNDKELKLKYRSIQEIRLIKDDMLKNRSIFIKFWHIYKIKLRNDHLWLGICCRHYGTHYTDKQRIAVMMVRFLTTLAVSALFYGQAKDTTIGDFSLSLYESLLGFIPMFITSKCIKENKPSQQHF